MRDGWHLGRGPPRGGDEELMIGCIRGRKHEAIAGKASAANVSRGRACVRAQQGTPVAPNPPSLSHFAPIDDLNVCNNDCADLRWVDDPQRAQTSMMTRSPAKADHRDAPFTLANIAKRHERFEIQYLCAVSTATRT